VAKRISEKNNKLGKIDSKANDLNETAISENEDDEKMR